MGRNGQNYNLGAEFTKSETLLLLRATSILLHCSIFSILISFISNLRGFRGNCSKWNYLRVWCDMDVVGKSSSFRV